VGAPVPTSVPATCVHAFGGYHAGLHPVLEGGGSIGPDDGADQARKNLTD